MSHQLYIWSWLLYFTRHEETLSGPVSAGAGGAHSPAWLAVGAATGNGGRVTQLSSSCHPAVTSCCQAAADCRPGLGVGETSQNVVTAYVMLPSCWHPSFPDHQPPPLGIWTHSRAVVAWSDTCQSLLSSDTFGNVKNYQAMKNYI